jgi:diguanylate cyclase (GGDEF)-like protein
MVLASLLSLMAWGVGRQIALGWRLRRVIDDLVAAFQQRDVIYDSQTMLTAAAHPRRQPVSGQIRSLVGIAEAFHAEWRFLQALIETHRHPVLVVDPQQHIILSNSAGSALFGTQAAGASLPHLLSGMLDADGRSELAAAWQAVHDGAAEVTPPLIQHGHQALAVSFLPLTGGRGTLCLFEDVTALHRRANTDGLTGLWNRRYFDEKLAQEIARFHRYGQDHPVALILLDIDHFKHVNDTHGHPVGDQVLKLVAGTLQATVRTTDLAVRYGGEEMAVLLTHTDREGAMILADRLRLAVTHLQAVDAAGRGFRVSASFGVAVSRPGDTPPALIARADKALYLSKTRGRNRVTAEGDGRSAGPDTDEET